MLTLSNSIFPCCTSLSFYTTSKDAECLCPWIESYIELAYSDDLNTFRRLRFWQILKDYIDFLNFRLIDFGEFPLWYCILLSPLALPPPSDCTEMAPLGMMQGVRAWPETVPDVSRRSGSTRSVSSGRSVVVRERCAARTAPGLASPSGVEWRVWLPSIFITKLSS